MLESLSRDIKSKFAEWKQSHRKFATGPQDGVILELKRNLNENKENCEHVLYLADAIAIHPDLSQFGYPTKLTEEEVISAAHNLEKTDIGNAKVTVHEESIVCFRRQSLHTPTEQLQAHLPR